MTPSILNWLPILQRHISLGGNVYLHSVDLQGEGIYKCEATAGIPTFQTVYLEQYLEVYSKEFSTACFGYSRAQETIRRNLE